MKIQHLRSICEIAEQDLNATRASANLNISQPGISHHIRVLEQELGFPLFVREKNRLAAITPAGKTILPLAQQIVSLMDDLRLVSRKMSGGRSGSLTIATATVHARSTLPAFIKRFLATSPQVEVKLRLGSADQIVSWVKDREADIGFVTGMPKALPELDFVPCSDLHRVVIVPPKHPLLRRKLMTMEDIASYPLIGYEEGFSARTAIMDSFAARNLTPRIVLSVNDPEVMKTYVASGMGIAVVANTDFDPRHDHNLRCRDAQHLFPSRQVYFIVSRERRLNSITRLFANLLSPKVSAQ